jgi:uncharacterized protein YcnI
MTIIDVAGFIFKKRAKCVGWKLSHLTKTSKMSYAKKASAFVVGVLTDR